MTWAGGASLRWVSPLSRIPRACSGQMAKTADGLTMLPWRTDRCMTWDVTVADTVAPSYLATTYIHMGGAAELAEARKKAKYTKLMQSYHFVILAFETMGPIIHQH